MTNNREAVEAEARHHLDYLLRHCAFRIIDTIRAARRLAAIAVAAQIRRDWCNTGQAAARLCTKSRDFADALQ
jgi:hypothetical protein